MNQMIVCNKVRVIDMEIYFIEVTCSGQQNVSMIRMRSSVLLRENRCRCRLIVLVAVTFPHARTNVTKAVGSFQNVPRKNAGYPRYRRGTHLMIRRQLGAGIETNLEPQHVWVSSNQDGHVQTHVSNAGDDHGKA